MGRSAVLFSKRKVGRFNGTGGRGRGRENTSESLGIRGAGRGQGQREVRPRRVTTTTATTSGISKDSPAAKTGPQEKYELEGVLCTPNSPPIQGAGKISSTVSLSEDYGTSMLMKPRHDLVYGLAFALSKLPLHEQWRIPDDLVDSVQRLEAKVNYEYENDADQGRHDGRSSSPLRTTATTPRMSNIARDTASTKVIISVEETDDNRIVTSAMPVMMEETDHSLSSLSSATAREARRSPYYLQAQKLQQTVQSSPMPTVKEVDSGPQVEQLEHSTSIDRQSSYDSRKTEVIDLSDVDDDDDINDPILSRRLSVEKGFDLRNSNASDYYPTDTLGDVGRPPRTPARTATATTMSKDDQILVSRQGQFVASPPLAVRKTASAVAPFEGETDFSVDYQRRGGNEDDTMDKWLESALNSQGSKEPEDEWLDSMIS